MATLTVNTTTDFSGDVLSNIGLIDFTNTASGATATFAAAQFDDIQIATNVAIDGSTKANHIVVNGNFLDASAWTFTNWSSNDTIAINGTTGDDTLVGSR